MTEDERFMAIALEEARRALAEGLLELRAASINKGKPLFLDVLGEGNTGSSTGWV